MCVRPSRPQGVQGLTAIQVKRLSQQKGRAETYRKTEIFSVEQNFFAGAFATNPGPGQFLGGFQAPVIAAPGRNTICSTLTLGATCKLKITEQIGILMTRPEVRYGQELTSNNRSTGVTTR